MGLIQEYEAIRHEQNKQKLMAFLNRLTEDESKKLINEVYNKIKEIK